MSMADQLYIHGYWELWWINENSLYVPYLCMCVPFTNTAKLYYDKLLYSIFDLYSIAYVCYIYVCSLANRNRMLS